MCKPLGCPRKLEQCYTISPYIAEFWNTISNIPFILIALARLYEGTYLVNLYILMAVAGAARGIHHAAAPMYKKYTIILDWIPIAISIVVFLTNHCLCEVSLTALLELALALVVLVVDHVCTIMPVPWGHVMWHLLAAFSIDAIYQSINS